MQQCIMKTYLNRGTPKLDNPVLKNIIKFAI